MPIQTINIGQPDKGSGDTLYNAFNKVVNNFNYLDGNDVTLSGQINTINSNLSGKVDTNTFTTYSANTQSQISAVSGNTTLQSTLANGSNAAIATPLTISATSVSLTGATVNIASVSGATYNADYSAKYVDRSLIDLGHLKSRLGDLPYSNAESDGPNLATALVPSGLTLTNTLLASANNMSQRDITVQAGMTYNYKGIRSTGNAGTTCSVLAKSASGSYSILLPPASTLGTEETTAVVIPSNIVSVSVSFRQETTNAQFYLHNSVVENAKTYIDAADTSIQTQLNSIKSIPIDGEIIPSGSTFDVNTVVTSGTAGVWTTRGSATISKPVSDYIRLNRTATSPSGLINTSIFADYATGITVEASITARWISGSTEWGLVLNQGFVSANNPNMLYLPLTSGWTTYTKTMTLGSANSDKRALLQNFAAASGAGAAEFKNISFKVSGVNSMPINDAVIANTNGIESLNTVLGLQKEYVTIVGDSISTATDAIAYEMEVLSGDVGSSFTVYPTYWDVLSGTTIGGYTFTTGDTGNATLITPNSGDIGKKIGQPLGYNSLPSSQVWWGVMANTLGWEIVQNVSWAGSSITSHENIGQYVGAHAWSQGTINKIKKRDSLGNVVTPTMIIIYRGTNDFSHSPYTRVDNQYSATGATIPVTDLRADTTYGFKEGYSITIQKYREAYPFAKIVLCTLNIFKRINYSAFPTNNGYNTLIEYSNAVRELADIHGCGLIELDKCGITWQNMYPTYISDSASIPTHPNTTGQAVMGTKAIKDVTK
jgi:hypothetical protein